MVSTYIYIYLYIYRILDDTEYPGGGFKYLFIRPDPWGKGIQFNEQMSWNHQLVVDCQIEITIKTFW